MNTDTMNSRDSQPLLVGLVKCQGCGSPLTVSGDPADHAPRYVCPNAIGSAVNRCGTPQIETRRLDELVVDRLVTRLLTDDLLQELIAEVRLEADRRALEQQQHLGAAQDELDGLQRDRTQLVTRVEEGETSYREVSDRLNRMGDSWHSIKEEAHQAEWMLEVYRYVAAAEDRVAFHVRNTDTYLRQTNAADTRGLLEMFIEEILVVADSVAVVYQMPLPLGGDFDDQRDVIPL